MHDVFLNVSMFFSFKLGFEQTGSVNYMKNKHIKKVNNQENKVLVSTRKLCDELEMSQTSISQILMKQHFIKIDLFKDVKFKSST